MDQRRLLYLAVLLVGLLVGYGIAQQAGQLHGDAIKGQTSFLSEGDEVQLADDYICCCLTGSEKTCWSRSGLMGEGECSSSCSSLYNADSYKYADWK